MLGQKHVMYDAEPQYLNQMGFMFLAAIQPILEKEVISELKKCRLRTNRVTSK